MPLAGSGSAAALGDARGLSPKQRWGSAEGNPHEAGGDGLNYGKPVSERSKYVQPELKSNESPRNTAKIMSAAARPTGFDAKRSVEIPDLRGQYERVFHNADGTETTEFSHQPLNFRQPDGRWQPIDPKLTADPTAAETWSNTADSVQTKIAASSAAQQLVRLNLDAEHQIAYGLAGGRAVRGQVDGTTVIYPGVVDRADLKIESRPGGVKEVLVLHDAQAPRRWVFPLHLKGLTAKLVDGRIAMLDVAGKERAQIPPGFMTDSAQATETSSAATSFGVTYRLIETAGTTSLEVTLDSAWLDDPARKFPVLVDPTVEEVRSNTSMYVEGSRKVDNTDELRVGNAGAGSAASYIAFPGLETRLRNHKVFGAQLQVVNFDAPSCKPAPITVHAVTAPWSSSSAFPGPAVGAALAGASFAHGYMAIGQTRSACPAGAEVIDLGVPGQELVQRWVRGEQANHGLSLRTSSAWKKLTGSRSANPPKLYITHTPYDAGYTIEQPIPNPPVTSVQSGKVRVNVANRGALTWTTANYALAYRVFRADNGERVGEVEASSLPRDVPPGDNITLDATVRPLPYGSYVIDFTMVHRGVAYFTDEQVAPARISLEVFNVPPVITAVYPPSGHSVETLTPQLWASAQDHENDPLQYRFEVCEIDPFGNPANCVNSGYQAEAFWTVTAGKLHWGKTYQWRAFSFDGNGESEEVRFSALLTSVPQPEVTSRLGNAPYTGGELGFDPLVGNYSTAAIDLAAATVGPELNVARTYNSLDPRRNLAFGTGWASRYDVRVIPDGDGSGNVILTYPDGQQARFGRNPDGTYAPPPGRYVTLTAVPDAQGGGWTLTDKDRTVFTFRFDGGLVSIRDGAGRTVELAYNVAGDLWKAISRTSNRALEFTWSGGHVTEVKSDAVAGTRLTWIYRYDGDRLLEACNPEQHCTRYQYETSSHYRSVVQDSRADSYWRMGEASDVVAQSQVASKAGSDNATYVNVNHGYVPAALSASADKAVQLRGNDSYVKLPDQTVNKHRDLAVELWFKTTSAGPLVGYQNKPIDQTSTDGVPMLYVGEDGKLRGQFWHGRVDPITTSGIVNDGAWHHVVLSGSLATQSLYLDGNKVGTSAGVIDHPWLAHTQIGAAYSVSQFPGIATGRRFLAAEIDEVAFYARPLGDLAVKSHYAARSGGDQVTRVTLPSMRVAASIAYDSANDRMREFTDANGGRWQLVNPTVGGGPENLIRTASVIDPAGRPRFYDYDALKGRILRQSTPLGTGVRAEDVIGSQCTTGADGIIRCKGQVVALGVRLYDYDTAGFQTSITDERGDRAWLTHDDRGNLVSKKSCRATGNCQTSYFEYQAPNGDPTDPRTDKLIASRDARSSSATDNTYRTASTYTAFGDLATETSPDGGTTSHAYTDGTTAAVDGGTEPMRLLKSTTDPRGALIQYRYFRNGDLAETVSPTGLRTTYEYDVLGRMTKETEFPEAYPLGVSTTFGYDALSRLTTTTGPTTTNAVTATTHVGTTVTGYDLDGNVTRVEHKDSSDPANSRVTISEYDQHGRLSKTIGPQGDEASYGYDSFGNQTWVVDANGVKTEYRYTARNKLAEVRLRGWHGQAVTPGEPTTGDSSVGTDLVLESYTYDDAGRLLREVDAMGRAIEYRHFADGLVSKVIARDVADPVTGGKRDVVLQDNTYDAAGHLVRQVGPGGRVVAHEVDATGRLTATTADPDGLRRRTAYEYDLGGNVTKVTRTGAYSNAGRFAASFAEVVEYGFDFAGRQTSETQRGPSGTSTTTTGYDQRGLITKVVSPLGNVAGANPADHTTEYRYDQLGRTVATVAPKVKVENNGAAPVDARPETVLGYNAFGELAARRNAQGDVVRISYNRLGQPVRTESPSYRAPGATSSVTSVTTTEYDAFGKPTVVTDAAGAVTRNRYDQRGRLVEKQDPNPDNPSQGGGVWRYEYTHTGEILAVTDPTGARVESTYDEFDRPITTTMLERKPTVAAFTTHLAYDDAGQLVKATSPTNEVTRFAYDALGQRTSVTDPAGVVTQFGYDSFGNKVWTKDAKGRASLVKLDASGNTTGEFDFNPAGQIIARRSYSHNAAGAVLAATDAMGKTTRFNYDAGGRLTQRVEPVSDTDTITTSFGYDASGRRTRVTDGRGNNTLYTFNSLGLPESVIEPATAAHPNTADRTWTAAYDAAGRSVKLTAPGGISRDRTYDGLGRLVRETGAGAESATTERGLGYDPVGRLTKSTTAVGDNLYTYNDRGRMLTANGISGVASYDYDAQGRPLSRVDGAGTTGFTYAAGRLQTVQDATSGSRLTFGYTTAGELGSIDYGNGVAREFGYDDFGREASDTTKNAAGALVGSIGYTYDLNHRLTKKVTTGTAAAGEQTYGYDHLGRVTAWTNAGTTTGYGWDKSGNRVLNGAKTATFDERNRVLSDGDYTYQYTARGTTASRTSSGLEEKFDFDAFDRLIKVGATVHNYDSLDRPVTRGGQAFTYAGLEMDPVTDGTATYGRGASGELISLAQGADKRLLLSDKHGDIVGGFAPGASALADSTAFDPFGKPTATVGAKRNVGFQGDWTAPDTGQVNMGARWYEPKSGSFTSRDTVDQGGPGSGGLNRYVYGVGSPINGFDPDGHGWFSDAVSWVGDNISTVGHIALDVVGMIPVVGEVADGINGVWYLAEGNYTDAAMSFAGMIPGVGNAATAGKYAAKYGDDAVGLARGSDNVPHRSPDSPNGNPKRYDNDLPGKKANGKADAPGGGKSIPDPRKIAAEAAAKRAAAAKAAFQAAVARTSKAKAAVARAVKSNPLPTVKAALKPKLANPRHLVSTVANAPARIVQQAVSNVQDLNKVYDSIKASILGVGKEIIQEAVQAQVEQLVASSPLPFAGDLLDLVGNRKRGSPKKKGQDARADAGGKTCPISSRSSLDRQSFDGSTPVLLADGTRKPIRDVREGDKVLATDPTTGESGPRTVTDTRSHQAERLLYEVTVTTDSGDGSLVATDEHPFWVESLQKWVHAQDLKPGYTFETADHRPATVAGIRALAPDRQVYNLTVDGLHTYFVGLSSETGASLLTHNDDALRPLDECFREAAAVRDEGLDRMYASMSRTQVNKNAAMIVGAVDRRTGIAVIGIKPPNRLPYCAEDDARCKLIEKGARKEDIVYSTPYLPNSRKPAQVCPRCQERIPPEIVEPGTEGAPGGAWGG
ncbi:intein N-terminal splicing region/RHS repeat-associated core domain-containing protein [Actinokineospora alba]|uniref:Intein N-terminal splicing region/RHS repeat-associated core domain-containing protein n=1 Tax=Actinokineospora alba TaxID=504798 RepID=A0A1H0RZ70_9PSEU|nr:intein/RHS repeat-associated protein [Actinokineospora alba]SDI48314.1 intein N-terminal splicing region/RHS repeat-associated core domain-containing protein [Actinokineospora alba]SDP34882.1 intein N-terminal splicing region/RHS repeat-associated core domain-containing protein [Actinokineospora alba]